jgi:hypothetical protein
MNQPDRRKNIDLFIEQFWKQGYLTVSRKFGRYLPSPENIGSFEIDVIARYKKDYAIGIYISEADMKDSKLLEKITFLATRQTRFSNKPVQLFVGIPSGLFKTIKALIENIDEETRKTIRLFRITEKLPVKRTHSKMRLFS